MNIKTIIFSIIFSSLALSITSCSNNAEDLKAQVFAIHDEVMPKMDDIYTYRTALLEVEANGTIDKKNLADDEKAEIARVRDSLTLAQIAMEDWMHNYKADIDNATNSEKAAYFTAELPKIQKVRTTMLRIIELGKATCKKYPKKQSEEKEEQGNKTTITTTANETAKNGTETATKTTTETTKTDPKNDTKTTTKTISIKSPNESVKIVEKTTETTETAEKGEKTEKTPVPPAPTPPAPTNMKTVQPKVSTGATKVPR